MQNIASLSNIFNLSGNDSIIATSDLPAGQYYLQDVDLNFVQDVDLQNIVVLG